MKVASISLSEGRWITIRDKRGWAAASRIEGSKLALGPDGKVNGVAMQEWGWAVMDTAILACSWLPDEPLTRAHVFSDDFDPDFGNEIVAAIETHYKSKRRTDEGKPNADEPLTAP